jgi:hypothetical protein
MVIDTGIILAASTVVGSLVVWSIRQEGRINGHDKLFAAKDEAGENMAVVLAAQARERHESLQNRLVRIETKLDSITGLSSRR